MPVLILGFLLFNYCSSEQKKLPEDTTTLPSSELRIQEIQMIQKGDREIKARALFGDPTFEEHSPNKHTLEWYLIPTEYQENAYKILKKKPDPIPSGVGYIKIESDDKGVIQKYDYLLK